MEPIYLPFISPRDYDTFRRILNSDLPTTYDEWFKLHTKERADRGHAGHAIREIRVNANEFFRFLNARGMAANLKALEAFTAEKVSGKQY
jgi:hypothetical protein